MAILIVDDMELNREILSVILGESYEILEAGNGLEALGVLNKEYQRISLIILDIVMPVMDGFGFLQRVKKNPLYREIPIVFVTAEANEENVVKGVQGGVCDIIAKPFDPYLVHNRVGQLIQLTEQRMRQAVQPRQPVASKRPGVALIVDDMEINRVMLQNVLEKDYQIETAENGEQALALLEMHKGNVAVVLLDIIMPVMDGVKMMDTACHRKLLEDVPVIAITADESPIRIQRLKDLGICEIIPKPFDPAVVKNRVKNMVELYSSNENPLV